MLSHESTTKALIYELINSDGYRSASVMDRTNMLYELFETQNPNYELERIMLHNIKTVTPEMLLVKKILESIKEEACKKENPHNL
jgi:hypothetical protein